MVTGWWMLDATAAKLCDARRLDAASFYSTMEAKWRLVLPIGAGKRGKRVPRHLLDGLSSYSRVDKETSPFSPVGKRYVKDPEPSARACPSRRDKTLILTVRDNSAFQINSNVPWNRIVFDKSNTRLYISARSILYFWFWLALRSFLKIATITKRLMLRLSNNKKYS